MLLDLLHWVDLFFQWTKQIRIMISTFVCFIGGGRGNLKTNIWSVNHGGGLTLFVIQIFIRFVKM